MRISPLLSAPIRRSLPLLGLILMGVVVAACGGGGSTKTASPATTVAPSTTTGVPSAAAYAQCLRQHGVTSGFGGRNGSSSTSATSSTVTPPSTVDQATMAAARQACASLRPANGGGGGGLNGPANAAYRACLQQHGVTLPSTVPGSTGTTGPSGGFNRNDPAFTAAAQACASLRPVRAATPTTT